MNSDPDTYSDDDDVDDKGVLSPGSTATGSGTSIGETPDPAEVGTTEADVSDGRDQ